MEPGLTIVIDDPNQLDQLAAQTIANAELIAYGDAAKEGAAAELASSKGWSYQKTDSLKKAVRIATKTYIVEWAEILGVAHVNVLEDLVATAEKHPELDGARTPNFDGMHVWRIEAFDTRKKFAPGTAYSTAGAIVGRTRLSPHPELMYGPPRLKGGLDP